MNKRYLTLSLILHPLLAALFIFIVSLIARHDSLLTLLGAIRYFIAYVPFIYFYGFVCSSVAIWAVIGVAALVTIIQVFRRFSWLTFCLAHLFTGSLFLLPPILMVSEAVSYCGP